MFPITPLNVLLMAVIFIVIIAVFVICIRRELR
jgi:hypothetical protein